MFCFIQYLYLVSFCWYIHKVKGIIVHNIFPTILFSWGFELLWNNWLPTIHFSSPKCDLNNIHSWSHLGYFCSVFILLCCLFCFITTLTFIFHYMLCETIFHFYKIGIIVLISMLFLVQYSVEDIFIISFHAYQKYNINASKLCFNAFFWTREVCLQLAKIKHLPI